MEAVELRRLEATCSRVATMAKETLAALRVDIVLRSGDQLLLPCGACAHPVAEAAARVALVAEAALWTADRAAGCAEADGEPAAADPAIRFVAATPIRRADGPVIGALCALDIPPRPYDAMQASWLTTLAQAIASECAALGAFDEARSARANVEALVDAAPMAIAMTDAELRCLRYSPRWLAELGIEGQDIIGKTIFEVFPNVEADHGDGYRAALAGETVGADALWIDLPNGRRACLRCELSPWRTPDGAVGGVLIFAHDLAEMQQALDRSNRVERRLKIATEIADLHVFEADYAERVLVGRGAQDVFFAEPLTFEQLRRDPFCGVHADDRARVAAEFNAAMAAGRPFRSEYRVARSDGASVWAASAIDLEMGPDGRPARVIGTLQNITARKVAEQELIRARDQAEAASRAKSEFLATISHEIRTPLNGVLGMAQAMAADDLSSPQHERLKVLHRSGEALLALLNDVLDLAKIEAGRLELEEAEFDLEQLCHSAAAGYAVLAESKGVRLRFRPGRGVAGRFLGDETRVRQILHNLLSNAIKFTASGEVRLSVRRSGGRVSIAVADTGIGIAGDKLDSLFDKFVQADASTTRRFGGTGLGLAIARDLARMMGGRIAVESREGAGSTFTVTLPLVRVGAARTAPGLGPGRAVPPQGAPARPLRVLAAEDNAVNQLVLQTLLGQAGIEPTIVADGVEAVRAWAEGAWDVVLMDVHMPVMDGVSAAREIRAREAASGRDRTPIIALTANAMNHQVAQYVAAGMDHVVAKPLEVGRLFAVLDQALDQAAPLDEVGGAAAGQG
jgi:PAS domain S-box-containing protein